MTHVVVMVNKFTIVPSDVDAELTALSDAVASAVDMLGLLPDEITALLGAVGVEGRRGVADIERRRRHLVSVASALAALLADPDEIREWLRTPNPGLGPEADGVRPSPLTAMLLHDDALRAIRTQLDREMASQPGGFWRH